MSDVEEGGKKSGYRLEYASSARAKCKGAWLKCAGAMRTAPVRCDADFRDFRVVVRPSGPKPCAGQSVRAPEYRMHLNWRQERRLRKARCGSVRWSTSRETHRCTSAHVAGGPLLTRVCSSWRHWGCVTPKIINNMKAQFESADELDGFEDLNDEDQERIRKAWEDGHVADEDIPETARKPDAGEDEDGKPAKKKATKASAKKDDDKPGKFKLEYASSSRAKCKGAWLLACARPSGVLTMLPAGGCDESIGKDFFRLGHEVDFRGNKSLCVCFAAPVCLIAQALAAHGSTGVARPPLSLRS